jgi:glycosyltransferase involved in cell wall biosynthesis/putative flippase GtrA
MKLLVVTQRVDQNDDVLGFFFGWLKALAGRVECMTVVCLGRGAGTLPSNTQVFSLGKESYPQNHSKNPGKTAVLFRRITYAARFYLHILREWNQYDTVFVHMNQEYVLLAGWLWRLGGKKVLMWRNHARGSFLTTTAVFLSNTVFCTSVNSYTARFKKTVLMPVGVDTEMFKATPASAKKPGSILFLSRIAPVKKQDIFVDALAVLNQKNPQQTFSVGFYGDALPKDIGYFDSLKSHVRDLGLEARVAFYPGVPHHQASALYQSHRVFINLTPPGSFDKTIVESLACGTLVLTANTDLAEKLPAECVVDTNAGPEAVAAALERLLNLSDQDYAGLIAACAQFVQHHSLANLIDRLSTEWGTNNQKEPETVAIVSRITRYISAGCIGLAVNVGTLYTLTHFFNIWYLASSAIAFSMALVVSFTLQKFWTFRNRHMDVAGRQFLVYFSIAIFNLLLNSLLVYFFTGVLGIWYVGSQVIAAGLIGISSFFLYRAFVFSSLS